MRLIDADELTRRIEKSYLTKGEKRLFSVKVRHMPTFDLDDFYGKAFRNGEENALKIRRLEEKPQGEITNDDVQQAIKEGFANGYEMAKEKFSPKKGEWICKTKSTFPQYQPDEYICPFCNTIVNYKTNFCHKCGADMKGGADNG